MDITDMNDVTGEEWAKRIQRLAPDERAARMAAVNTLLAQPEDLCAALETELYILRDQLQPPR